MPGMAGPLYAGPLLHPCMEGSAEAHAKGMVNGWLLFLIGGGLYVALEYFWRGWSHPSMFFTGGAALVLMSGLVARFAGLPLIALAAMSALLITALEFVVGALVNVRLGLKVWDYSRLPHNLYGQVCLRYSLLWFALSVPVVTALQLVNTI